ncbi:AP-3 complex subunit sigma-1 isoform X6 [Tursiops truncatus]|uniref:AP-3 complex subunit sigma-1 isoform X6 n=1 Tax=Tursiops truncatus TaxID=9739 RepID=UPI003CCF02BF
MLRAPAWSCFRFPPRRPRPGPALSKPCPAAPGGARARACAGGGGWGRIASEIPRRGSRARPRPGPQLPPGRPGSAMIKAILIFNNHGKPRLSKFYQPYVFVETLDKCFENVCELDLIFHVDKVHNILAEMVMGGMVLETNMNEIVTQIDAQNKLEKSEAGLAGAPARAVSAVKNMNLPEIPRNINIGDISIKVPNLPSFK